MAAKRTNIQPEYRSVGRIFHDAESHDRNDCNNARMEHHQIICFKHYSIMYAKFREACWLCRYLSKYAFRYSLLYIIYIIGRYGYIRKGLDHSQVLLHPQRGCKLGIDIPATKLIAR